MNKLHLHNSVGCLVALLLMTLSSCSTIQTGFLAADVVGFSERVETSYGAKKHCLKNLEEQKDPYNLMSDGGVAAMTAYVNNEIPRGKNTAAYYAVETACDRIRYIRQHQARGDKFTKYYIFLLTDGLDNNSPEASKKDCETLFRLSPEKYRERLQRKLRKAMGWSKNVFEVYPMLYEGDDIKAIQTANNLDDEAYYNFLRYRFECFRYSSTGNAPPLIFASDFEEIFSQMKDKFISSSYEFMVPKSYLGKRIKMIFKSEKGDEGVVTGVFVKKGLKYTLEELEMSGMTMKMTEQSFHDSEGSNVVFRMEEMTRDGFAFVVGDGPKDVQQFYQEDGLWIVNSEYNTEKNVNMDTYFILVIDGSTSLDGRSGATTEFDKEKEMAEKIINMVINK